MINDNPLNRLTALVFDYGSYFSVAERISRPEDGFGIVYYHVPYVHNGYPDHRPIDIGRGINSVIRVREWASVINNVDIVIFCDAHEPALMEYFQSIGKKVFGAKQATELEHDRKRLKELMVELGLPTNKYEIAEGVSDLDEKLKDKTNVFIKAKLRGDLETFHHENYNLSKGELGRLKNTFGAYSEKAEFIIEQPIESICEIGIDTMCVDGLYLSESLTGIELKDTGYYGQILPYKSLPKQLRNVTDSFSEIFRQMGYRGAYSNEVMIDKKLKGYLIDNTCRFPQPPTDLILEIYDNFPEIVWQVANGVVPKVKYTYKHGVQFIIKSDLAKTDPSPIVIPEEYKNYVKIKNVTLHEDGTYYYTPLDVTMCEIGSVIGLGSSMRQAINMAKKIADSLKGFDIKINTDCIGKAQEQIDKLKAAGINYLQ